MKRLTAPGTIPAVVLRTWLLVEERRKAGGGGEHRKAEREWMEQEEAPSCSVAWNLSPYSRIWSRGWGWPCPGTGSYILHTSDCNIPRCGRFSQSLGPATRVLSLIHSLSQYSLCCLCVPDTGLGINRSKYLYSAHYLPGLDRHWFNHDSLVSLFPLGVSWCSDHFWPVEYDKNDR